MATIVMIVPPEQFRDEELFETKNVLEEAGHTATIASTTAQPCVGMLGGRVVPDLTLAEIQPEQYDAIVLVGGLGVKRFYHDSQVQRLARTMDADGKVVAAICLAPIVLANAGLLHGKRATVMAGEAATIERQGARYAGPGVVVDGRIITGDGPKSARRFGREIAMLLATVAV